MRIVLANPHSYNYGKTVLNVILQRKNFIKYDYFIKYYLNDRNKSTAFYVNGSRTSFKNIGISFCFFPKFFMFLELIAWMIINKINPFKSKIYFNINKLDKNNDILVDFSRSFKKNNKEVDIFKGISFIFFSHYFTNPRKILESFKKIPNYIVAAENDLSNAKYFNFLFPFVKKVYYLPFTFAERFHPIGNFRNKKNKCLALGSRCVINNEDFIKFFKSGTLHPMRKIIYDNSKKYSDEIDSIISPTDKSIKSKNSINVPFFLKNIKKYIPYVILERLFGTRQSKYFKFNIVEKYNGYKMFICPEEVAGLPSINAFEGMACGCAYIGINDSMYTNLGLIPGVHYISYKKNDFDDLISKIRYYQNNPEILQKIAEEGCKFVRDNFNKKIVAEKLWKDLEIMHHNFLTNKKIDIICSFEK